MKTPKFLICENPLITGNNEGRLFVLHAQAPIILAEAHHFDKADEQRIMDAKRAVSTGVFVEHGGEYIILEKLWAIPDKEYSSVQAQADDLAGVMRRMADWYRVYLIGEDKQDGLQKINKRGGKRNGAGRPKGSSNPVYPAEH